MDEPANGLDPAGIVEIRNLLQELVQERGVTVFMSSHILAEVARLAQRIGMIHQGHLLQELSMEELERNRRRQLTIRTRDGHSACSFLRSAGFNAQIAPSGVILVKDMIAVEQPDEIAARLVHAGYPPAMLIVEEEDLENYFLRLIGMEGGHHE